MAEQYIFSNDRLAELLSGNGVALEGGELGELVAAGELGYVHSYDVGSNLDGPGLRFVLWTTGCFFRCQYCHNPDTWKLKSGHLVHREMVMDEIEKYLRFLKMADGGITISGGEPLVQVPFVRRIFEDCKEHGIHTTLDTNGYLGERLTDSDLKNIDLVLLDIKSYEPATHLRVTGAPVDPVLNFAQRLARLNKPTWVRFVLVPGLTDDPANVQGIADFVAHLKNVERVEILPFHQLGRHKWEQANLPYRLAETDSPSDELIERVKEQFKAAGVAAS